MQKYQTFSQRFWAGLIDAFLIATPLAVFDIWLLTPGVSKPLFIVWAVFSYLAFNVYTILMHGLYGQTLGKMVTKVKVVDISEVPITMWQSVLRDGVWLLLCIGCIANSIYLVLNGIPFTERTANGTGMVLIVLMYVWIFVDIVTFLLKRRQRAAHDLIAGTVVVRLD